MYVSLMVRLELGQPNTALLQVATGLAERLQASVTGVAVCQPMRIIYNDGYVPGDLIDQDRQQIDDEMKVAEAEFSTAFGSRLHATVWRPVVTHRSLSAQLADEARSADLVITGLGRDASLFDTSRHVDIGDLVLRAGRPCLIVPSGVEELALEHAVIGWKDTGETRQAVSDAVPLLKQARRVTVVEIATEEDLAEARAHLADVVGWLKQHGIEATSIAALSTGDDAIALKAIIRELGVDLVVAGAYGHSRVREWVLGGVTRDFLLHPGRCTLVSH